VYAVWYNMVASDARKRWPDNLIDDARVTHFWDEERVVGRWFASKPELGECTLGSDVAWDAYYLFSADARWGDAPKPLITSGCPIVRTREQLEDAVERLAAQSQRGT
jgi:hypothetical protein